MAKARFKDTVSKIGSDIDSDEGNDKPMGDRESPNLKMSSRRQVGENRDLIVNSQLREHDVLLGRGAGNYLAAVT